MAETELIVREDLNPIELFTGDAMGPLVEEISKRVAIRNGKVKNVTINY